MSDESKVLEYKVAMTCEGCSNQVNRVLSKVKGKGVENFNIDLENQKVTVTSTLEPEEVLEILKKTGKSVEFLGSQKKITHLTDVTETLDKKTKFIHFDVAVRNKIDLYL